MARHHSAASLRPAVGLAALVLILFGRLADRGAGAPGRCRSGSRRGRAATRGLGGRHPRRGRGAKPRDCRVAIGARRPAPRARGSAWWRHRCRVPASRGGAASGDPGRDAAVAGGATGAGEGLVGLPLSSDVSGTILSNTVVNSAEANWLEGPNLVGATSSGSMTHDDAPEPHRTRRRRHPGRRLERHWEAHPRFLRRHARLRHRHGDGAAAAALRLRTARARRHRDPSRAGPGDAGAA